MAISGLIGAGAQDALLEQLQMQLAQQAQADRVRLAEEELRQRNADGIERSRQFNESLRQRQIEQQQDLDNSAANRRSQVNLAGLRQMGEDREAWEAEQAGHARDAAIQSLPPEVAARIKVIGALGGKVSSEDLLSDQQRADALKADEDADVRRAGRMADAQAAAAARYRSSGEQRHPHVVDGKLVYLTEDEVNARGGVSPSPRQRPVTGQERTNLGFYQRAQQANEIAQPLEAGIAKMGPMAQARLGYQGPGSNWIQSPENQSYRQAQRAFTEARLRKESGAAIPEGEYENDAKTYFAQPGDGPDVIKQKQAARKIVLESLGTSTGGAWDEYYGEPRPKGGGESGGVVKWEVGPDGIPRKVGG